MTPLLTGILVAALGAPVPADMQATFFKRIFGYDEALKTVKPVKVGVVHRSEDDATARAAIIKAFTAAGMEVVAVRLDSLGSIAPGLHAVYVQPRSASSQLRALCEQYHLLSITDESDLVTDGEVSVGVRGGSSGKPELVINIERLTREHHKLAGSLMLMAGKVKK